VSGVGKENIPVGRVYNSSLKVKEPERKYGPPSGSKTNVVIGKDSYLSLPIYLSGRALAQDGAVFVIVT
jgi:hypothetical protein